MPVKSLLSPSSPLRPLSLPGPFVVASMPLLLAALSGCAAELDLHDHDVPAFEEPDDAHLLVDAVDPMEIYYEPTERMLAGVGTDEIRDGDLRPETLELFEAVDRGSLAEYEARLFGTDHRAMLRLPRTIRVWRRSLGGPSASCSAANQGYVHEIPIETYVKGVLPNEWIPAWNYNSLRAGAVLIRTYATYHAMTGGKYDCADVDDTPASQVYRESGHARTDWAVENTAGVYLFNAAGDRLLFTEYSAENGDPTLDGIRDAHCTGERRFGHGRGACQWGTARWAHRSGRNYLWILNHYFPGSRVLRTTGGSYDSLDLGELPEEDVPADGGCSAAGGTGFAPLLLLALLLAPLRRRRAIS